MKKSEKSFWDKPYAIHIIAIICSLSLIFPYVICNCTVTTILSSIGSSGVAAAIVALYISNKEEKKSNQKLVTARRKYFSKIYKELVFLVQRILWYSERLDDNDFNWNLQISDYLSIQYMCQASTQYPSIKTISNKEAIEILKSIGNKYSFENITKYSESEQFKINKMFNIIAASSIYLLSCANDLKENELTLDKEDYISLENNNIIVNYIALSISIMNRNVGNYYVAISCLNSVIESIQNITGFTDKISIRLQGTIDVNSI